MAEEEEEDVKSTPDDLDGLDLDRRIIYKYPCSVRTCELARPAHKYRLACEYYLFNKLLPRLQRVNLEDLVREEFALTPEEAELYFREERAIKYRWKRFRAQELALKRNRRNKQILLHKQQGIKYIARVMKKAILKAYNCPVHIVMTDRLREMSDIILATVCKIRNLRVPRRSDNSIMATFLFALSDYFAVGLETIFYDLEMDKCREYDRLMTLREQEEKAAAEAAIPKPEEEEVALEVEVEVKPPTPPPSPTETEKKSEPICACPDRYARKLMSKTKIQEALKAEVEKKKAIPICKCPYMY